MKRIYLILVGLFVLFAGFGLSFQTSAQKGERRLAVSDAPTVSPNVVVSQIYGGGGISGAQYTNDFVELFNRGDSPVNLAGWSTQYASASGTEFLVTPLSSVTLQPGQYYLIQYASNGTIGGALPMPDLVAPPVTNNAGITFTPNLSSTTGKLALVNSTVRLPASTCPLDATIVDFIGYGISATCYEGARTANLSATTAAVRGGGGCTDTDNNAADFAITAPAPRNTSSAANACSFGGTLQAGGAADPNVVSPNSTTRLTVSVIPATTAPSTSIMVVGNLAQIGGAANQQFFDDGTNGDLTPNDNVFSYLATIPNGIGGGSATVTAVASDAEMRTANVTIGITINAPAAGDDDPLNLGNPTNATPDPANENNYLMPKPQYTLSYNRSRNSANWVAWHLNSSWIGTAPRQDDFRPDSQLPTSWYHVTAEDYSSLGSSTGRRYDRGHMAPSGDRTRSVADNSATFLMTNMLPQLPANNQGPWNDFENYLRTLAQSGNEIYIVSGGAGNLETIAQGRIVVPQYTWKVVLILGNGDFDLSRITKRTRTIGIIIPNQPPITSNAWRNYRVSVNDVEALTGYNFYSNIPYRLQETIEGRIDTK